MNEGILNKVGRFLYTKQPMDLWASLMLLQPPAHSGRVAWNDFSKLKEYIYGSAYTCIDVRSRAVSTIPIKLYSTTKNGNKPKLTKHKELTTKQRKWIYEDEYVQRMLEERKATEIVEITEHPSLDLLSKVNKKLTQSNFKYLLEENLLSYGNAFVKMEMDGGLPTWLRFMDPCQLDINKLKQSADGAIESYTFGFSKNAEVIPGDEIIHFFFPTVEANILGVGPLCKATPSITVEMKHDIYVISNFENMGNLGGVISLEGNMSEEQRKTYEKTWQEKFRGADKAGQWMVTKGGEVTVTPMGTPARDMALDTTWRNARESIANRFMIPLSILTMESSNRAVALQGSVDFWTYAGWPDLTLIHEELTESLASKYDESLFFLHENPIPTDIVSKVREMQANLNTGKTTINEEREQDNLPPVDGGDINLVPGTAVPLNMVGMEQPQPPGQVSELARQIIEYIGKGE